MSAKSRENDFTPGIATCSSDEFLNGSLLTYIVSGNLALVLDKRSIVQGKVLGLLLNNDIICVNLVELPWIRLKAGSFVRHPSVREGKIKLQREGWMISTHPTYGELLGPFPSETVKKFFQEDSFAKLPIVKTVKAKAKPKPKTTAVAESKARALPESDGGHKASSQAETQDEVAKEVIRPLPESGGGQQVSIPKASVQDSTSEPPRRLFPDGRLYTKQEAVAFHGSTIEWDRALPATEKNPRNQPQVSTPEREIAAKAAAKADVEVKVRIGLEPEMLIDHLRICSGQHWKVVHKPAVFVRSACNIGSDRLTAIRGGAVICIGLQDKAPVADGWIRLAPTAKVWYTVESETPELIFPKGEPMKTGGYMLKSKPEIGDLLRLVPNTGSSGSSPPGMSLGSGLAGEAANESAASASAKAPARAAAKAALKKADLAISDLNRMDHLVVEREVACVFLQRDEDTEVEMELHRGDVLLLGTRTMQRTWKHGSKVWLLIPPGAQVYRKPPDGAMMYAPVLGLSGFASSAYVVSSDTDQTYLAQYVPPETGITIRVMSGYGEPWVVEHDQVVVRRKPTTTALPVGILQKGDVAGVRKQKGAWVELMQDSEVRFRKVPTGESTFSEFSSINSVRTTRMQGNEAGKGDIRLDESAGGRVADGGAKDVASGSLDSDFDEPLRAHQRLFPKEADRVEAWMMVEHPRFGQLLRRARKRKGGLTRGCVLSDVRHKLYREVINLCHRRIYEENLEDLWEGERDKMPSSDSLEAKLFECNTSIIHVTSEGKFAGGAILKTILVAALQKDTVSNFSLSVTTTSSSSDPMEKGFTTVGYIDSCATEPGSRLGKIIWDVIVNMPFVCVTCHSILLQKTVDFWQARGMRRLDPSKEEDCDEFKRAILMHTTGKVVCELADVIKVLPSSKLPLFVWVSTKLGQQNADPNSDHMFTPIGAEDSDVSE